jgi:hypothetical protein
MDLNPREAVVDQEPLNAPEQEEAPTHALLVPERFVEAVMEALNRLEAELGEKVFLVQATGNRIVSSRYPNTDWDISNY